MRTTLVVVVSGRSWGGGDACRQRPRESVDAFGDELPGLHYVRMVVEDERDRGEALHGPRANRLQAGHAAEGIFDRLRDEGLHLLAGHARCCRLHDTHRRRKFGKYIELRARQREEPITGDHDGQREDDAAKAQRKPDDRVKHGAWSRVVQGVLCTGRWISHHIRAGPCRPWRCPEA